MPRLLRDITIKEVSSVDRGAGRGVKVMLMKRDGDPSDHPSGDIAMTKEELDALVAKSVKDAVAAAVTDVTKTLTAAQAAELAKRDFEIAVLKMSAPHKTYMDGCDEATQKKFAAMSDADREDFMGKNPKKRAADPVHQDDLTKRDVVVADLQKRLDDQGKELAQTRLEKAQADFKKRAVDAGLTEADGETMRKAYGGDAEAQAQLTKRFAEVTAGLKKQVETGALFKEFGHTAPVAGTPMAEIQAKADELRKADPKLTKEQAFAKAYEDPANAEIVGRARAAEMRKLYPTAAAA